jgi:hypothetical protein
MRWQNEQRSAFTVALFMDGVLEIWKMHAPAVGSGGFVDVVIVCLSVI